MFDKKPNDHHTILMSRKYRFTIRKNIQIVVDPKYQQPNPKKYSKPKYTGFDLRMGRTIRELKSFTPHYEIESKI
jgi:hypothetical protein